MVKVAMNFSRNGLSDWLLQRISAIVLAAYTLTLAVFLASHAPLTFSAWQSFMLSTPMKLFSVLALLSLLAHAWIGLWTIATDYIQPLAARLLFHALYALTLLLLLLWGIHVLWIA